MNQDEAIGPDGKRRQGLLAYLRDLTGNGTSRRDVIATVFRGVISRMVNGYAIWDGGDMGDLDAGRLEYTEGE